MPILATTLAHVDDLILSMLFILLTQKLKILPRPLPVPFVNQCGTLEKVTIWLGPIKLTFLLS